MYPGVGPGDKVQLVGSSDEPFGAQIEDITAAGAKGGIETEGAVGRRTA